MYFGFSFRRFQFPVSFALQILEFPRILQYFSWRWGQRSASLRISAPEYVARYFAHVLNLVHTTPRHVEAFDFLFIGNAPSHEHHACQCWGKRILGLWLNVPGGAQRAFFLKMLVFRSFFIPPQNIKCVPLNPRSPGAPNYLFSKVFFSFCSPCRARVLRTFHLSKKLSTQISTCCFFPSPGKPAK